MLTLAARGVHVLLSNSSAPLIVDLFERHEQAREAGLQVHRVPARRAINTRADRRGAVEELLVSTGREGKSEK